jgi:zinc protease
MAFDKFENEGINEKDLNRIKAGQETDFYTSLSSVLGKGTNLASYNTYTGDPGFLKQDIQNILSVTTDDVLRVYNKYIKGKNYLSTSFVPKNKVDLALEGSFLANVKEEEIIIGAETYFDPNKSSKYVKSPSSFDRTKEPDYGEPPSLNLPNIYRDKLANGMEIFGIQNNEVPLVNFNLTIEGGQLLEPMDKLGLSNLTSKMLNKGTVNKTVEELEKLIKELGASIYLSSTKENINISVTTLSKNYIPTLKIVEEILLFPRFELNEFSLLKKAIISELRQQRGNPNSVANNIFNELIYGDENIRSKNILGTLETVETITLEDVKQFYEKNISPSVAKMLVVGNIGKNELLSSLNSINSKWKSKEVIIPKEKTVQPLTKSQIYFYDIPNAKQSVLKFGSPALAATDNDYFPATMMNYILGGGGFASRLTQELREGKGYTYGINSRFSGTKAKGNFVISTGVRSNVTFESANLIKEILEDYPDTFSENDLQTSKSFLIKSNARAFETSRAKLNILSNISKYDWDIDYIKKREQFVNDATIKEIKELALKYINPEKMIWLVVGDAKTQYKRMKSLGFGNPVLINSN